MLLLYERWDQIQHVGVHTEGKKGWCDHPSLQSILWKCLMRTGLQIPSEHVTHLCSNWAACCNVTHETGSLLGGPASLCCGFLLTGLAFKSPRVVGTGEKKDAWWVAPRLLHRGTRRWLLDTRGEVFTKIWPTNLFVTLLQSCCWIWHTHLSLLLRWLSLLWDKQACPGPSWTACVAGELWVCHIGSILTPCGANGS